jgi:hypothetical protein
MSDELAILPCRADAEAAVDTAPLAFIGNYDDLQEALRKRADVLKFSRRTIDNLSGMPDGYCEKLLGPAKRRKLGMKSLGAILGALGG